MRLSENLKKPCRAKDFKHKCEMLSQFMRRQNTEVSAGFIYSLVDSTGSYEEKVLRDHL